MSLPFSGFEPWQHNFRLVLCVPTLTFLTADNSSSRQQEAHPDRFHDLPADASLELSTPGATTDGNEATVNALSAMLPPSDTASPQGSTPQALAAAQKLARGEKLPKAVNAPAGQKLTAQLEELSSKCAMQYMIE
jgi:hypothetical protein